MAKASESSGELSVHSALKGDFQYVKPKECQPPELVPEDLAEETDKINVAKDKDGELEDGFDTAASNCDDTYSLYDDCVIQLDEDVFSMSENKIVEKSDNTTTISTKESSSKGKGDMLIDNDHKQDTKNVHNETINNEGKVNDEENEHVKTTSTRFPERTATDQFIFRNQFGQLKRFHSTLQWIQATTEQNKDNCLDCAAQISTRDLTSTVEETTATTNNLHVLTSCNESNFDHYCNQKFIDVTYNQRSGVSTNYNTTVNERLSTDLISNKKVRRHFLSAALLNCRGLFSFRFAFHSFS